MTTTRTAATLTRTATLAALVLLLGACVGSTPPSRHYVLTPLEAAPEGAAMDTELVFAVGPVSLPAYLDRPQIVLATGPNERRFAELARWAEPLDAGMNRTLRENLSRLLGSEHVTTWPGVQTEMPTVRVAVQVLRFDVSTADGQADLQARWTLFDADGNATLVRRSEVRSRLSGDSEAAWIDALSSAVAELSKQIALEVHAQAMGG